MLAAALLLMAVMQSPAPPPQDLAKGLAPPQAFSPEQRAAAFAGATLLNACIVRLGVVGSAAEFAKQSDALGVELAHDYPAESATVTLDGDGGLGCRVRYTGPLRDKMWSALADLPAGLAPTPDHGGCVVSERTDDRMRATCTDTAPKPPHRADLVVERAEQPGGALTAALVWRPLT